jgi:Rieske Fe-S protein
MSTEDPNLTRRGFLQLVNKLLAVTGVAVVLGPIIAYFWPNKLEEVPAEPVVVGDPDSIPVGQSKTIRFGRYPALVINTAERGLVAYSAVCTHFACIVNWNEEEGVIECPCHEGYFRAEDGSVISGPPPRPLDAIPIFIEDDTLFIGGEA